MRRVSLGLWAASSATMKSNSSRRVARAGPAQSQNVMAQPVDECSDVARQLMRLGLGLPRKRQLGGKLVVWTPRASVLARPSHWRWMWNTSPWHGVSPQAACCPACKLCPASAIV